ncbi:MAG: response regulator [Caldilineae bacterium]|nr:MAG: response regulator [Caldilineae bacterium]
MLSPGAILVVDDDTALCYSLALLLRRAGYTVTTASHPRQALQCLQAQTYDLVFLDIKMPDIDGLALLSYIRRSYPQTAILILSAYTTPALAAETIRRGACACLSKPLNPADILTHVRNVLAPAP